MFIVKEIGSIPFTKKDGSTGQRSCTLYVFECDTCGITYKKKPACVSKSKSGLTFCSKNCRHRSNKKGSKLCRSREKKCIEKYGVINPSQLSEVQEKGRKTLQERYGKNVTSPLLAPGARAKRRRTHLERYGAEETFQIERFVKQRAATWLKRYGVPYHPFPKDAFEKAKKAMLENPIKWSSKIEIEYGKLLRKKFGDKNVIAQKWVNRWPIDFYVKTIDTYIQFDGVYWHCLDIPLTEIRKSEKPRDKARVVKWETDREQEAWFSEHNLRLIRITDIAFKQDPEGCIECL